MPRWVALDLMGRQTESICTRYRIVDQGEKRVALHCLQEYLRSAAPPTDHIEPMPSAAIQQAYMGTRTLDWRFQQKKREPISRLPFNLLIFYEFVGCGERI